MNLNGIVTATQIISLRFAQSGRLAWIKCAPGNLVKKGAALAGLETKEVQTQLDIELADYRRMRAEFDKVSREIPEPKNEDEKTLKEIIQARLDISIKNVEKIKQQQDSLVLTAPSNAVILSTQGLITGVNVTPSGFPIEMAETDSVVFELLVDEADIYGLKPNQKAKVKLKNGQEFETEIVYLSPQANKGKFAVWFKLPPMDLTNFRLGTTGKISW